MAGPTSFLLFAIAPNEINQWSRATVSISKLATTKAEWPQGGEEK